MVTKLKITQTKPTHVSNITMVIHARIQKNISEGGFNNIF